MSFSFAAPEGVSLPRFELDPDGQHVWWYHHCVREGIMDDGSVAGGFEVVPESQTMLPKGKEKAWTVVQKEPLTVVPSILCFECNTHGFITNGEWVAC